MKQNVFQYAANCERMFEANLASVGNYERKTTFYSDLSIAEYYNSKGVIDTYRRVMKEWIGNIEYITEFVMCLNYKIWEWHGKHRTDMVQFYDTLYNKADAAVLEYYKGDKKALEYYYKTTD